MFCYILPSENPTSNTGSEKMREINVLPEFTKGKISFPEIVTFEEDRSLGGHLNRDIDSAEAVTLLETMLYIRSFEEMIIKLKNRKVVPFEGFSFIGATHLSIGQEAVAAGTMSVLRPDDYITSTHRGHGHSIGKGLYHIYSMDLSLIHISEPTRPY